MFSRAEQEAKALARWAFQRNFVRESDWRSLPRFKVWCHRILLTLSEIPQRFILPILKRWAWNALIHHGHPVTRRATSLEDMDR